MLLWVVLLWAVRQEAYCGPKQQPPPWPHVVVLAALVVRLCSTWVWVEELPDSVAFSCWISGWNLVESSCRCLLVMFVGELATLRSKSASAMGCPWDAQFMGTARPKNVARRVT